ncbi:MAG: hypothetical protein HUU46_23300 [Candidatus Hydrogenedentes bacterium]|nr:hypothetical protein [Candidatus Hydrogenedentota bacterium]
MLKQFIGGAILGSALTIVSALLVGPNITLADVGSGNGDHGARTSGRYQLEVDEQDGVTTYSIFDTQKGVATVATSDGKSVVVSAESGEHAP